MFLILNLRKEIFTVTFEILYYVVLFATFWWCFLFDTKYLVFESNLELVFATIPFAAFVMDIFSTFFTEGNIDDSDYFSSVIITSIIIITCFKSLSFPLAIITELYFSSMLLCNICSYLYLVIPWTFFLFVQFHSLLRLWSTFLAWRSTLKIRSFSFLCINNTSPSFLIYKALIIWIHIKTIRNKFPFDKENFRFWTFVK